MQDKIKIDKDSGCWLWTGTRNRAGYGKIVFDGKIRTVTRLMMEVACGLKVKLGELVLHRCDNPPCINPAHFFLGNHRDNAVDMIKKCRNSSAKLTKEQVIEIRELCLNGYWHSTLAEMYGVDESNISLIVNRKRWRHI